MTRNRYIAQAGLIAAIYAVLTIIVTQVPWGYGPVQFRLSEAATILALFSPAAIPGLTLGCALGNAFMIGQVGALALLDVVFGSLATLLGARWTYRLRARPALALLGPVVSNALIVPAYLPVMLAGLGFYDVHIAGIEVASSYLTMYLFGVLTVAAGEAVVVLGLGYPLQWLLRRAGLGSGDAPGV